MRKSADELIASYSKNIQAPSPVLGPLLSLLATDEYKRSDVESLIRMDPCLTKEILQIANSSSFSGADVCDIGSAMTRLGEDTMTKVVIRASSQCMKVSEVDGYGMHGFGLWSHGLRSAIAAGMLAKHCPDVDTEVAYTAGLLLDVGKRVLGTQLAGREGEALMNTSPNFVEVENELFGCSHAEIGAHMARRWKLPPALRVAMRWHHQPSSATEYHSLVWVCHVADFLALNLGGGGSIEGLCYKFESGWQAFIDLSESEILALLPLVHSEATKITDEIISA